MGAYSAPLVRQKQLTFFFFYVCSIYFHYSHHLKTPCKIAKAIVITIISFPKANTTGGTQGDNDISAEEIIVTSIPIELKDNEIAAVPACVIAPTPPPRVLNDAEGVDAACEVEFESCWE
jgi:hypothetical protein